MMKGQQKSTVMSDSALFSYGAGNGNRTHLPSLGSSYSTDELCPQLFWKPNKV